MNTMKLIREEIELVYKRDPAIKSKFEVFLYPGFKAILCHRLAHKLYKKKHFILARFISQRIVRKTGIEIHPGAEIGKGVFIDHGNGVVIGETAVVGNNVTIYQGVTLGGTGKDKGKRHPTIGNDVMISAGAKVLGPFNVGNNVKIGANAVVLKPVPDNSTVVGIPGRMVKQSGISIRNQNLEHGQLPDPIKDELSKIETSQKKMEQKLERIETEIKARNNVIYGDAI